MYVSALELFRIGPGPSSSRTLGPQRAALRFVHALAADGVVGRTSRVDVHLFGSLALTGRESATDHAVMAGLCGDAPERSDARSLRARAARVEAEGLVLGGRHPIAFDPARNVRFHMGKALAYDGNALRFDAFDPAGDPLASRIYFTGGSGEVLDESEAQGGRMQARVAYPFASGETLLGACRAHGKKLADLARANELAFRSPDEVRAGLSHVALAMRASVQRGLSTHGALPGGGLQRRAADQLQALQSIDGKPAQRCAVYATAVAEENAAGGCVVTAPTHGAAGPVAALLEHWRGTSPLASDERAQDFLLAAAAIGQAVQAAGLRQAGCQSVVGVGAAMAAAGYVAAEGGSALQVVHGAERALEEHWGLACDSEGGRVQQPCIARNAAGAACAIDAAQAALRQPAPRIAIDALVRSMIETGRGMAARYKADALSGVARNIADC
ncbi:MAG TPA: L-serine ammonia-lyase [Casimicrobiaceae bacterium]|nr:L-serine ammonia-lyase [Casimicrobiaceae bacterium]